MGLRTLYEIRLEEDPNLSKEIIEQAKIIREKEGGPAAAKFVTHYWEASKKLPKGGIPGLDPSLYSEQSRQSKLGPPLEVISNLFDKRLTDDDGIELDDFNHNQKLNTIGSEQITQNLRTFKPFSQIWQNFKTLEGRSQPMSVHFAQLDTDEKSEQSIFSELFDSDITLQRESPEVDAYSGAMIKGETPGAGDQDYLPIGGDWGPRTLYGRFSDTWKRNAGQLGRFTLNLNDPVDKALFDEAKSHVLTYRGDFFSENPTEEEVLSATFSQMSKMLQDPNSNYHLSTTSDGSFGVFRRDEGPKAYFGRPFRYLKTESETYQAGLSVGAVERDSNQEVKSNLFADMQMIEDYGYRPQFESDVALILPRMVASLVATEQTATEFDPSRHWDINFQEINDKGIVLTVRTSRGAGTDWAARTSLDIRRDPNAFLGFSILGLTEQNIEKWDPISKTAQPEILVEWDELSSMFHSLPSWQMIMNRMSKADEVNAALSKHGWRVDPDSPTSRILGQAILFADGLPDQDDLPKFKKDMLDDIYAFQHRFKREWGPNLEDAREVARGLEVNIGQQDDLISLNERIQADGQLAIQNEQSNPNEAINGAYRMDLLIDLKPELGFSATDKVTPELLNKLPAVAPIPGTPVIAVLAERGSEQWEELIKEGSATRDSEFFTTDEESLYPDMLFYIAPGTTIEEQNEFLNETAPRLGMNIRPVNRPKDKKEQLDLIRGISNAKPIPGSSAAIIQRAKPKNSQPVINRDGESLGIQKTVELALADEEAPDDLGPLSIGLGGSHHVILGGDSPSEIRVVENPTGIPTFEYAPNGFNEAGFAAAAYGLGRVTVKFLQSPAGKKFLNLALGKVLEKLKKKKINIDELQEEYAKNEQIRTQTFGGDLNIETTWEEHEQNPFTKTNEEYKKAEREAGFAIKEAILEEDVPQDFADELLELLMSDMSDQMVGPGKPSFALRILEMALGGKAHLTLFEHGSKEIELLEQGKSPFRAWGKGEIDFKIDAILEWGSQMAPGGGGPARPAPNEAGWGVLIGRAIALAVGWYAQNKALDEGTEFLQEKGILEKKPFSKDIQKKSKEASIRAAKKVKEEGIEKYAMMDNPYIEILGEPAYTGLDSPVTPNMLPYIPEKARKDLYVDRMQTGGDLELEYRKTNEARAFLNALRTEMDEVDYGDMFGALMIRRGAEVIAAQKIEQEMKNEEILGLDISSLSDFDQREVASMKKAIHSRYGEKYIRELENERRDSVGLDKLPDAENKPIEFDPYYLGEETTQAPLDRIYPLPLSYEDANLLYHADWESNARPALQKLKKADFWLSDEALQAFSWAAVEGGDKFAQTLADSLIDGDIEALSKHMDELNYTKNVNGKRVLSKNNLSQLPYFFQILSQSISYNETSNQ